METTTVTVHLLVKYGDDGSVADAISALLSGIGQYGHNAPLLDWSYALSGNTGDLLDFQWDYDLSEYNEGDFMARIPANQQCRGEASQ